MTNQDSQSRDPLVTQEAQELREVQLEKVAGGVNWRCCFGASPTKEGPSESQIMRMQHDLQPRPGNENHVADLTSISMRSYEPYKQQQQQRRETVEAFKQLPFHPR